MREIVEKLEHGIMVCEATGTTLVHIDKDDAEKILELLEEQAAKETISDAIHETAKLFRQNCSNYSSDS